MTFRLLVALARPLHYLLTYLPDTAAQAKPGCRVIVPLGHSRSLGMVVATESVCDAAEDEQTNYTLKPVQNVLDASPLLDAASLQLLQWAARYYHYPIGEVIFATLPSILRDGKALPDLSCWEACASTDADRQLKRAKRQRAVYQWLRQHPHPANADELRQQFGSAWRHYIQGLQTKALVRVVQPRLPEPDKLTANEADPATVKLTELQASCLQQCQTWLQTSPLRPILLHGITGSGKTEIYLQLMTAILAAGQQVLVLVPEIGLTPQLVQRFTNRFPQYPLVRLHSGLNDSERVLAWQAAREQRARIIIGTRSAVFAPCPALGLIVVDEEHDQSFKQQDTFRYHGRDLAIKRAQLQQAPIILGSATPSLETLYNVDQQRYHYTRLNQRPGAARTPSIQVQDIRGQTLQSGLSQLTLQTIRTTLERNEQVMLFINRRGFAPVLLCPACGWQASCESCSATMTFHARQGQLICHHCSQQRAVDQHCPHCSNPHLTTQGQGTERIELTLQHYFADTPVVRIDRDSISRKGALQAQLDTIAQQERLLLVGTQMLAKGHDFPNLTLVVILEADQSLLSPEYHALERFGQLMTQVAGRAGRKHKAGQVILQTTQPQHPILLTLLENGYLMFARQLLEERRRWQLPPFAYQALIRADALEMDNAMDYLLKIRDRLSACNHVQLMGPTPAPLEKKAGRYRAQLLLQALRRDLRHQCLLSLTQHDKSLRNKKNVRWSIDIDPVELS